MGLDLWASIALIFIFELTLLEAMAWEAISGLIQTRPPCQIWCLVTASVVVFALNVKEMTTVLIAIRKWLHLLRGKHLVIYGDNFAVSSGLKKRSINGAAMAPLRDICMLLALHDVTITSNWISTKENILADLLSRGKWSNIANSWPQLITNVTLLKSGTAKLV